MTDDRTTNLDLPLPHAGNKLVDDVARLRTTLQAIDTYLNSLQEGLSGIEASIGTDIASLVGGKVPAEQLPNTDALAEGLTNLFFTDARARAALQAATSTTLGGIKVGSGLSVGLDGMLSTIGSGSGEGLPAFNELVLTPSTNGQTTFTPAGGYEPGNIDLYLNGVFQVGNGVNYTASNGTTIVLATGVNTSDRLLLRRWTTTDSLPFSALLAKPTTREGYGITDVPLTDDTLLKAGNLAGLTDVAAARASLGLGTAAVRNLIGSVAQSGGVPTGAIMEIGQSGTFFSTGDEHYGGFWLKLANGWAVCWRAIGGTSPNAITTAVGTLFVSAPQTFNFPIAFVSTPIVIPFASSSLNSPAWAGNANPEVNRVTGIYLMSASNASTARPGYLAIGRWF